MRGLRVGQIGVWALTTLLVWQSAWLSDDSLITVRTALNWASGYGPQFNVDEAVQSYTHPLWFLLMSAIGALTGSWIYGLLYLNVACASGAVLLLVLRTKNMWQLITIGAVLILGNTALDWSTSGLEGAVSVLLLTVLGVAGLQNRAPVLGFIAGLMLLCRLDFILLLAPWVLVHTTRLNGWRPRVWFLGMTTAPVLLWAIWARAMYGFILPATFSAKTNSEIPLTELAARGLEYLTRSLAYDPMIIVVLAAFLPLLWFAGDRITRAWVIGVGVYLGYVILVGGDYMLGRFMLVPLYVCLLELTRTALPSASPRRDYSKPILWGLSTALLVLGLANTRAFDWRVTEDQGNPAYPYYADERIGWTHWGRSLDPFGRVERRPPYNPTDLGFLDKQASVWSNMPATDADPVVVCHGLGGMGLLVGPRVHIIDPCGLSDRFLASIPFTPSGTWKAGHFERPVPAGYVAAVKSNDPTQLADPRLAEKLGELWRRIRRS